MTARQAWRRLLGAGAAAAACALGAASTGVAGWQPAGAGLPAGEGVLTVAVDAARPRVAYAGLIRQGIYRTDDGGRTWRSVTNLPVLPGEAVMTFAVSILSLVVDASRPGTTYAGTSFGGLLATRDGGRSWQASNTGLEGRGGGDLALLFSVDALALSPSDPAVLYAAIRGRGVYRSASRGARWVAAARLPATDLRSVAVHPARPEVVYAGTLGGGVFKSADGGAAWRARNRGLGSRLVQKLVVVPGRPWVVYAATHGGVFKSVDGGRRWRRTGTRLHGVPVQDLVADPRRPRTLYAAVKGAGVYRTTDGGVHWQPFGAGLANELVTSLAIRPGRPAALYAGTLGGLFVHPLQEGGGAGSDLRSASR